jgi:hypothetical protein
MGVGVAVYRVDGSRLARLSGEALGEGEYELRWNGQAHDGRRLPVGSHYLDVDSGVERNRTGFVLVP